MPRDERRAGAARAASFRSPPAKDLLLMGYGNSLRRDDGLGPALAERFEGTPGVRVEAAHQLNAEDAVLVSEHDRVVFVDASRDDSVTNFRWSRLRPEAEIAPFSTHALSPETVLSLSVQLTGRAPEAFLLEIKGEDWSLGEGFSDPGARRLGTAETFLRDKISKMGRAKPDRRAGRGEDPNRRRT
jgi:hydrogenase maturation protease